MSWTDFDTGSSLERDVLARALPLVSTGGDRSSRAEVDLVADSVSVAVTVGAALGASAEGCIELLGIRPLLVGAAWKVIDRLLETAYEQSGLTPDLKRGWSIKKKVELARNGEGRPVHVSPDVWVALTSAYAVTEDLRHSLVHRRVRVDANRALVGVDTTGKPIRGLSPDEQDAFARVALRAAQVVIAPDHDDRLEADLTRQLGVLQSLHGVSLPVVTLLESLPEIVVTIHPDPDGAGVYVLDMPALRARQPFEGVTHADLVVRFAGRSGQVAHGRLEDAPDDVVKIDPDSPPEWLA